MVWVLSWSGSVDMSDGGCIGTVVDGVTVLIFIGCIVLMVDDSFFCEAQRAPTTLG